jgi:DNA-binding response OmpR family regulator
MKRRILIVDDDADLTRLLSAVLSRDYEVFVAASGRLGLRLCLQQAPDLVLLDLKLDDMGGQEVLKAILARRSAPMVVVLSANSSLSLARRIVRLGAHDYMSKPFDMEELQEMIRAALDGRPAAGHDRCRAG